MANSGWRAVAAAAAAALVAAGCGGGTKPKAAPTTVPATTSTVAPSTTTAQSTTTTSAPASTVPSTTATTSVVGLVVNGTGSTLTPPKAPTVKPYRANCTSLIDPGFTGECVTFTGDGATAAAIVEQQSTDVSATTHQERDLVYVRRGADYDLDLRRVRSAPPLTELWRDDVARDGVADAVFVVPSANAEYAEELDLVSPDGLVTLYRQLHGGFATVAAGGGLVTYVPTASGYARATIDFRSGAWRIVAVAHVSQSEAAGQQAGPFQDVEAQPANASGT